MGDGLLACSPAHAPCLQVQRRLWTEWHKLETASEGTLRNRGYRMAQAVLAREDPRETFLKNLPSKPAPVEVIYPVRIPGRGGH